MLASIPPTMVTIQNNALVTQLVANSHGQWPAWAYGVIIGGLLLQVAVCVWAIWPRTY